MEIPIVSTWTSSGDIHSVTTNWQEGETRAAQQARHDELVTALQIEFPPDP